MSIGKLSARKMSVSKMSRSLPRNGPRSQPISFKEYWPIKILLPVAPLEIDGRVDGQVEHVVFGVSFDHVLDEEELLAASCQVERVRRSARRVQERRLEQDVHLNSAPREEE